MFFLPIFGVWTLISLYKERKNYYPVIIGSLLGLGLAAFYVVPSYMEKNLVQIENY